MNGEALFRRFAPNVSGALLQSKPVIHRVKVAGLYNKALSTCWRIHRSVSAKRAVVVQTSSAGTRLSRLSPIRL